ncbi:menaquinone biosynthetic enzyme MqnA/MqnD family protein [Paenibacillus faecalis]|uniref:menaquinone biosynthetic enzyme MqnA/MqnD family protein n=1 Tax=Paenibacillus faecalis TaxID=2079532 RepID=UPI000D0FF01C|nr:menaquinone biosynthesis protein [Paenibacillus faecalis]
MPGVYKKTVIGRISYTNAWPLYYYVNPQLLDTPAEMLAAVPSVLNEGMKNGDIHIGALSSFAYAEAADKLQLIPDLSVSANGAVKSILLFSRVPVKELKNATIAMTNTSATSVNLLRILMEKAMGVKPEYKSMEPDLDTMMEQADAALLIGDNAIKASWYNREYVVTDLGEWWKEWTGCSMTFAVCAVNRNAASDHPEAMSEIASMFRDSKQRSLRDLRPIVNEAVSLIGGTELYWRGYFNNLCYDFNEEQQKGLRLYYKYAYELGLLKKDVTPELWRENIVMRVKE